MSQDFLKIAEFFSEKDMRCEEFASYVALAISGDALAWGMAAKVLEKGGSGKALNLSAFFRKRYISELNARSLEGDEMATRALVGFYEFGCPGFPSNPQEAVRILKEMANKGDVGAQFELFEKYLYGLCDLPQDKAAARYWLEKAEASGHPEAKEWMCRMETL